jgi:hypothetical protein
VSCGTWTNPPAGQEASQEDFARTKAGCLLQQANAVNNGYLVFPLCMRAQGWVLTEKR